MSRNNYWVSPDGDEWKAQHEGADRASRVFETQREAESYARGVLQNNGGGELITQSKHGSIRSKDTINSYDPRSSVDLEH